MEDKGLPQFNGEILILYISNAPRWCDDGVLIEYPEFVLRNGKVFLSGRIPEMAGNEWVSNTLTSVAWDSVIQYIEFKSIEEYKKRLGKFQATFIEKLKMLFR